MREPTSILAFRNGSVGNTLAAVPALRAIKQRYPAVPITVVVDTVGEELLRHLPWVNRLIVYEKHGKDRGLSGFIRAVSTLHDAKPSHAVLFKRFFRNGLLAYLSGARVRAGFSTDGRAPFLNVTTPYEESVPVVDLNLRLANLLGADSAGRNYDIALTEDDEDSSERLLERLSIRGRFIAAHYGGQTTSPEFLPVDRFAMLLNQAVMGNNPIVLLGHGQREAEYTDAMCRGNRIWHSAVNTPIRTTAAIIRKAELFVGFNSGPAHLAAAVGTPVLVLFATHAHADAEIRKWLPPSPTAHALIPPVSDDANAWKSFTDEFNNCSRSYLTAQFPSDSA